MNNEFVPEYQIRQDFNRKTSVRFGEQVPEYREFLTIMENSNHDFLAKNPNVKVDSEARVMSEKHGAIRVGTAEELNMFRRAFAVMGMRPRGLYDMTKLPKGALPIVGTAFIPNDETIEKSAFRMFCSMLHPAFITDDIKDDVEKLLSKRRKGNPLFSKDFIGLIEKYENSGGLNGGEAAAFTDEFTNILELKKSRIIDFILYKKLREKNDVIADIVCIGVNLNHKTPRVYDIEDAQQRMIKMGVPVKEGGIEGPPIREDGVVIQLNQTSRKAPGEDIFVSDKVREFSGISNVPKIYPQDGEDVKDYLKRIEDALKTNEVVIIQHKARFGEVESRGVALTEKGEEIYRQMLAEKRFKKDFPKTHTELFVQDMAYYKYKLLKRSSGISDIKELVAKGFVEIIPQTYDDFLVQSAAGIFTSNLSKGSGNIDDETKHIVTDSKKLMEDALGVKIINPHDVYKQRQEDSHRKIFEEVK